MCVCLGCVGAGVGMCGCEVCGCGCEVCGCLGVWVCACTYMCLLCLQEIELKDFTQHVTPKPSATAPAYDFSPFTDHSCEKGRDQTKHTVLSPPKFDFTSMSLNSCVKSPLSNGGSGSGGTGAARRRGRRYSDRFGNVRELRSLPYTGRRLWSGDEGMNPVQSENMMEEVTSKRSDLIREKDKVGSLTDSSNSRQRGGRQSMLLGSEFDGAQSLGKNKT